MFLAVSAILILLMLVYLLGIRSKDLPQPLPVSPSHHLDARKAAIYEGLRDLQFEYRLGKLSDADYQRTKLELQTQLAGVLAEIDSLKGGQQAAAAAAPASAPESAPRKAPGFVCPHCGAKFERALKFCGECGKAMTGDAA